MTANPKRNISHDKEVLKTFVCQYQDNIETFEFEKKERDLIYYKAEANNELDSHK